MQKYPVALKEAALRLRKNGYSYSEIQVALKHKIPKPTLNYWCRGIVLSSTSKKKLLLKAEKSLARARARSVLARNARRKVYLEGLLANNLSLTDHMDNIGVRKLLLASLYLSEGTKGQKSGLTFGNSNPDIIATFLFLLRKSFSIDESKFRVTVQARADQNLPQLESFWRNVTGIPKQQFYVSRVDPRSIGKVSKKKEYKGVCRINYFSNHLLFEILAIGTLFLRARSSAG